MKLSIKKSLLFMALASIVFAGFPQTSFAKKRYRYIKREHGLKFQGNFNINVPPNQRFALVINNLQTAYSYNWKGMIEVGPYFSIANAELANFSSGSWNAGLLVDYNIIKNRGKRKYVPSVGMKLGYGNQANVNVSFAAAIKYFVATRTPIYLALDYNVKNLMGVISNPRGFEGSIDISTGIAYYFDFY